MTSQNIDRISDLLSSLHGHAYFRPDAGALKQRLAQTVLDAVDGELAEKLASGFDLEVSVGRQEGDREVMVSFSVDLPGVVRRGEVGVSSLPDGALDDLAGYLERLSTAAAPAEPVPVQGKHVVRRKPEGDHHLKEAASARLKVSPEWLKSVVPCTDYSYDEIDGKKYIREYYWSKELIERLFKIKCSKTTPEDLQFVARECCEGDMEWAKDLIARLKSPNRPEPGLKEQSQKQQGKQGHGQGKQGQNPGKQVQNLGKQVQVQAKAVPGERAPGERVRQRSRHKRPFRKDGGAKGDAPASPKPPQNQ